MLNFPVPTVSRFVASTCVGSSGAFSDSSVADVLQKLSVEEANPFSVAPEHLQQGVLDVGQGGEIAQIDGVAIRALHRVGHHPAHEVAEQQMGVYLLDHAGGGMGTEVLDIETVLPFAINRLDLPTTVVEIDEFTVGVSLRIEERGEQPTWSEARPLVVKQTCGKNPGQVGILASGSGGGVEFNDPFIIPEAPQPCGVTGLLVGEPEKEMRSTQGDTPDGCVGKKSHGPSEPSHCNEGV